MKKITKKREKTCVLQLKNLIYGLIYMSVFSPNIVSNRILTKLPKRGIQLPNINGMT